MELLKVEIDDFGGAPVAEHNYPCPVYRDNKAVYSLNKGYFQPSWKAQKEGWAIIKADTWFKKIIVKWFLNPDA